MFSSSSIAQLLPLHIIESIIDYARATHVIDYKFDKLAALAFLHSCQSWRSVFLRRACSSISFTTDVSTSPKFVFCECPEIITPFNNATSQYVKHLSISTDNCNHIMDGSLLTWMLEAGVSNILFLSAKNLTISINNLRQDLTISEESTIVAIQNIKAFLQQIRSMVPNIKSAEIKWYNYVLSSTGLCRGSLIDNSVFNILSGLCIFRFAEFGSPDRATQLVFEYFSGLTHFDYSFNRYHIWFVELVRYNAGTLESLKTCHLRRSNFKSLLYNNKSEPISYPFLKLLKLEYIRTPNLETEVPDVLIIGDIDSINHFPILESFYISGDFPFVENVFIPGKNVTLRHLSIFFIGRLSLQNNSVFEKYLPTRFYNLSSISVNSEDLRTQSDMDFYTRQIEFLQSSLSCSTNVAKFTYSGNMDKQRFYQEAKSTSIFQSLQLLTIQNTVLSFSDIVMLLQSAIFLQHLECVIDKKAPTIKGIGPSKLPGYISSLFPLSRQFKSIKLDTQAGSPIKHIAKTAILLAIGCPRLFKFCTLVNRNEYRKEIDNISKTRPFSDYAEQCQFISSKICR